MESAHISHSAQDTEALGAELAARLEPGQVVLIEGDLGAGKTTFVRGAARALGVTDPVRSPTFTIAHHYRGEIPVAHVDLYRIADLDQEDPDLLAGYLEPGTIAFVEWPGQTEELAGLAEVVGRVRIEHAGADVRRIEIELVR